MSLTLRQGDLACVVDAELGGSILSLTRAGRDLLRSASAGETDVLQVGCFPLVPFANRIRDGRFAFEGRAIALPPDPAALPHAHHGHGWRRPWQVAQHSAAAATLTFRHGPGAWPWRYEAVQTIALDDAGLSVGLDLTNRDDAPMPAGLGLHPFFPRAIDTRIVTWATRMLTNAPDGIPNGGTGFAPGERPLADLEGLDTLLLGGEEVTILDGPHTLRIVGRGAIGFHCYVPAGGAFFCVEPVTHRPDSFRAEVPGERLDPRESCRIEMRIEPGSHT